MQLVLSSYTQTGWWSRWSRQHSWWIHCVLCCWISAWSLDVILFPMDVVVLDLYQLSTRRIISKLTIWEEQESSGDGAFNKTSELARLENFIAQTTVLEVREEKMKVVYNCMQSNRDVVSRCHDEGFEVTMSSSFCWRLMPFVVSYCCDIAWCNGICIELHVTSVRRPFIRCNVTREHFAVWMGPVFRVWQDCWAPTKNSQWSWIRSVEWRRKFIHTLQPWFRF